MERTEEIKQYHRDYQRRYRELARIERQRKKEFMDTVGLRQQEKILVKNLESIEIPIKIAAELTEYVQKNLFNDPYLILKLRSLNEELDSIKQKKLLQLEAIAIVREFYRLKVSEILKSCDTKKLR